MELTWNPWHGCRKYSEGCLHCYVYRRDESIGKDASQIEKTGSFGLPLQRSRGGAYKVAPGTTVYTCMTSDFFLPEADAWREEAWEMIRQRQDVHFYIITKRIVRFSACIPSDWGDGYENVTVCCTMENQKQCDLRFPVFNTLPIRHKHVICEPLLGPIMLEPYLHEGIAQVTVGGESGPAARVCDYDWVLQIRQQCINRGVPFRFKQTGANFLKGGRLYRVERRLQHAQAQKAGLDTAK